jgi:hypothetical protein
MKLRFHSRAIDLLVSKPKIDVARLHLLEQREQFLSASFPASIKEWYGLENAESILESFCWRHATVCPLDRLGAVVSDSLFPDSFDFLRHGMLWISHEAECGFSRAVKLRSDDPEVLIRSSTDPLHWCHNAESFSTFVYCQIWSNQIIAEPDDWTMNWAECIERIDRNCMEQLSQQFRELPATYHEGHGHARRFELPCGRLTIYLGLVANYSQWMLMASSQELIEKCRYDLGAYDKQLGLKWHEESWWPV